MKETLLFLCLTLSLMAQGIKIFVNNKPFPGKTAGAPADLYLECAPTLKLLGSPTQWEAGATEIVLEGKSLAVVDQAGVPMIRAKDLCTLYGGRYDFNKGMNTVDIYAYDPIAKAKEALARIIKQRTIESEADFAVITLVCRQYLTQTLGLKLTDDVELRLVDKAEMTKLSGRQLDTYVTYTKGKGSGTGRYLFHVLQGQSPSETIHSLGWAWGVQWENLNGDESNEDLSVALGNWTAVAMVKELVKVDDTRMVLRSSSISARSKDLFKELQTIERTGGVEAVLAYIKNQAKNP